jgi:hypothetical protein
MPKVIFIDVATRRLRALNLASEGWLKSLQALVGGSVETAWQWPTGDVCFVDEEALLKMPRHFFHLEPCGHQPFAGNGVVVGSEIYDDEGEFVGIGDTKLDVDDLASQLKFSSRLMC